MPSATWSYPTPLSLESLVTTLKDWIAAVPPPIRAACHTVAVIYQLLFAQSPLWGKDSRIVPGPTQCSLPWYRHKIWTKEDVAQWDRADEMAGCRIRPEHDSNSQAAGKQEQKQLGDGAFRFIGHLGSCGFALLPDGRRRAGEIFWMLISRNLRVPRWGLMKSQHET